MAEFIVASSIESAGHVPPSGTPCSMILGLTSVKGLSRKRSCELSRNLTSPAMVIPEATTSLEQTLNDLDSVSHIDVDTYVSLLQLCVSQKSLLHGRRVHQHITTQGHGSHMFLGFLVLDMYGKCGSIEDASSWFAEMQFPNGCAWNYMIGLYLRSGRSLEARFLFDQMLQEGKGYEREVAVVTALINLYGKCGDSTRAFQLFDGMPKRDTITWNALIAGYKQIKNGKEALQLFDQMLIECVLPSNATFACTLPACTTQVSLCQGKRMHVYVTQTGLESGFVVSNALVRMYSQCGSLEDAQRLFNLLSTRNTVISNAMIAAYAQHGRLIDALNLLTTMQSEGMEVDMISYIHMLDVCGSQEALTEGKQMHACIKRSGYAGQTVMGNALMSMYGRCKSVDDAQNVFDNMPSKNVISWNALMSVYTQNERRKEAMRIFDQMQEGGVTPNNVTFICLLDAVSSQADIMDSTWLQNRIQLSGFSSDVRIATSLIDMHGKAGNLKDAQNIFDSIVEPTVISWTAMMSAHSFNGLNIEVFQIFNQMIQQGAVPDAVTFLISVGACTTLVALKDGKMMHAYLRHCVSETEITVANMLINMYAKCGCLDAAWDVFDGLPHRNVATWNVIIATHAQHGLGEEALLLISKMLQVGLAPDRVSFVSFLSACSHAGLMYEAFGCLLHMLSGEFSVAPELEHYDCIVDLLGRSGQSSIAERVVYTIPLQPSPLSWMTLLTVCRNLLDVETGERSAKHVVEVDPKDHVPYIMLANIYSALGREEDAEVVISMMVDQKELLMKDASVCQTENSQ